METANFEYNYDDMDVVTAGSGVISAKGELVMIIEVSGDRNYSHYKVMELKNKLRAAKDLILFGMVVDSERMEIFKWDGERLSEPVCVLNTADILVNYEPKFREKRIYPTYLQTLVESWLDDLAYNWKREIPPASKELDGIGLLGLIKDGTTKPDIVIKGYGCVVGISAEYLKVV